VQDNIVNHNEVENPVCHPDDWRTKTISIVPQRAKIMEDQKIVSFLGSRLKWCSEGGTSVKKAVIWSKELSIINLYSSFKQAQRPCKN